MAEEQPDSFRQMATTGIAFIAIGQAAKLLIHLAALAALSRILSPSEFGVLAMMSPLLALATIVRDGGLTGAILQRQSISSAELSTLFWVNICWGTAIAGLFALCAPLIAKLYGEPCLTELVVASAAIVFMGSLSVQPMSMINRALRFRTLAMIDAGSLAFGYLVGIGLAVQIHSYWALWSVLFANALAVVVTSWAACRWRPSLPTRDAGVGDLLRTGGTLTLSSTFDFLIRSVDNVLIGSIRGSYELGLYDRAYRIVLLPLVFVGSPLERLVLPSLVRMREDMPRYRNVYRLSLQAPLLAIAPGITAIMATPEPVSLILLGHEWAATAPMLAWLALAGALQIVTNSLSPLLVSQGRARELTAMNGASLALACMAYLIGIRFGALGVAAAYAVSETIRTPVAVWWASRLGPVRPSDIARTILPFLVSAALAFVILLCLRSYLPQPPLLVVLLSLCVCYGTTIMCLLATASGRDCLREAASMAARLASASKRALIGRSLQRQISVLR